jgi:hypothetical protein
MSFLLEGDSSVAALVTLESTMTSQTWKKGKKSSPVWAHTRLPIEGEDPDLLYCSYCEQGETAKRALYGFDSSLAMTKHINRYHPLIIIKKAVCNSWRAGG